MKFDRRGRRNIRQTGVIVEQQRQLRSLKLAARRSALSNQMPTLLDKLGGKLRPEERRRTGHRATPFAGIVLVPMPNSKIVTQKTCVPQPYS
jgi:hypothetical protein